jgi:adenosine kinase
VPVAVTGSIATDHLMRFPGKFSEQLVAAQLHRVALSFLVDDLEIHRGGVGANIAFGMGVLGVRPLLVGAVGSDFDDYRAWLERHGVDCSAVYVSQTRHTARFVSTTDDDMCQISSFYAGAMTEATKIELKPIADRVGGLDLVVIAPDDPTAMLRHAEECRQRGYPFAVDPSQQLARLDGQQAREFIAGAKYLFSNDYEWELLRQKTGWTEDEAAEQVDLRITTLGEQGVQIIGKDGTKIEIPAVPAIDKGNPTGAGDGFRAGFLAGISRGLDLEQAAQLGALIGVLVLETVGPQEWSLELDSALDRLSATYGPTPTQQISAIF